MKHPFFTVLCLVAAMCPALGQCQEEAVAPRELNEIRISDPNWGFPAFFRQAPRNLVVRMQDEIDHVCDRLAAEAAQDSIIPPFADARDYVDIPGGADWLCQRGAKYFYRGVDGWGKQVDSGFVCERELGLPGQKYFGASRFPDFGCVFLSWDEETKRHEVVFTDE